MIDAVAWTLIHFLWQGTLVWLVVSLQLRFTKEAYNRYLAGCLAMVLMMALPLYTFMMLATGGQLRSGSAAAFASTRIPFSYLATTTHGADSSMAWMPLLVVFWSTGVGLLSLRNIGGLVLAYVWRNRAVLELPEEFQRSARRIAAGLRLRCSVRLRGSSSGNGPSVVGWIKPVIVVPMAVLGLPFEQLEAILAHELAHIRRHDFLVNLLQKVVETLLFYHPAVWWLGRRIREERENCCDDLAVTVCGNRVTYARALTNLASLRSDVPDLAMAATGGSLFRRIARLLGQGKPPRHVSSIWLVALITVFSVAVLAGTVLKPEGVTRAPRRLFKQEGTSVPSITEHQVSQSNEESTSGPVTPSAPPEQSPSTTSSAAAAGGYIGQIAGAGYPDLSVDDLIAFKVHDVTPEYARSFQSLGLKPTPEELVSMRIHDVSAEYAQALKASGFTNLKIDQLVSGRIHGVDPSIVGQLKGLGLGDLTFDNVVAAQIHNLTPEFVRSLKDAGFSTLTFDQAVAAVIHGIDANMVRELRNAGLGTLSFDNVVSAQIHGITPAFVRRAQQLGLKDLTFDKIVQLKILGILD
jgi:beta-lactamase regulating signal transducer with metallopeptidase domain